MCTDVNTAHQVRPFFQGSSPATDGYPVRARRLVLGAGSCRPSRQSSNTCVSTYVGVNGERTQVGVSFCRRVQNTADGTRFLVSHWYTTVLQSRNRPMTRQPPIRRARGLATPP